MAAIEDRQANNDEAAQQTKGGTGELEAADEAVAVATDTPAGDDEVPPMPAPRLQRQRTFPSHLKTCSERKRCRVMLWPSHKDLMEKVITC